MGKKRIEIAVGAFSSGPDGALAVGRSVVSVDSGNSRSPVDRMFAVIDARDQVVGEIHDGLLRAFEAGGPVSSIKPGATESYLDSVLDRITLDVTSHWNLSIALAVQTQGTILLATLGGAEAGICRSDGTVNSAPDDAVERTHGARIWQTQLYPGDSVVLGGRQVAIHVITSELRQTVQAGFSVDHASQWLTTLASTRSQKTSTALVARVETDDDNGRRPALGTPSKIPRMTLPRPAGAVKGGLVLTAFATLALVFVLILGVGPPGQNSVAAEPAAPNNLGIISLQPHNVLLSWDPSSGAKSYEVMIAGASHAVTTPYIRLNNVLSPGREYMWQARAIFAGGRELTSKASWVRIPTAPALAAPLILSPGPGPFPASQASAIKFCWTAAQAYTKFSLLLGGAKKHFDQTVSRSQEQHSADNTRLCVSKSLPPDVYYAWQLAASGPGYRPALTAWQHFSIAAVPTPTPIPTLIPTPLPIYVAPVATQAPAYNTGYNSAPTTGYNSAPTTGYNGGATTSPPVAPAPTPVPTTPPPGDQRCANPPNC